MIDNEPKQGIGLTADVARFVYDLANSPLGQESAPAASKSFSKFYKDRRSFRYFSAQEILEGMGFQPCIECSFSTDGYSISAAINLRELPEINNNDGVSILEFNPLELPTDLQFNSIDEICNN
jgi:hypothetical protein